MVWVPAVRGPVACFQAAASFVRAAVGIRVPVLSMCVAVGGQACCKHMPIVGFGGVCSVLLPGGFMECGCASSGPHRRGCASPVLCILANTLPDLIFASLVGVKWYCGFHLNFSDY